VTTLGANLIKIQIQGFLVLKGHIDEVMLGCSIGSAISN